jgi:ParB family transcriptional regulator, chromosome partitioning protein
MQRKISIDNVRANADQPRKFFDAAKLEDLANSIRENGLMQPITVRPLGGNKFEIVAGERRFRAHQMLFDRGLTKFGEILCNVRSMDEERRDLEAIVENLQRVDVTPLEEARAFQRLVAQGWEPRDLGRKLGFKDPRKVETRLRLLNLEPTLLKLFEDGHLSYEAAFHICKLPSAADQIKIARLVNSGALKRDKDIEAAVGTILNPTGENDLFGAAAPAVDDKDVQAVNRMEAKIEEMARMAATGWREGECVVATRVSRDRARLMADKLRQMQKALAIMERELRDAGAQAAVLIEAA